MPLVAAFRIVDAVGPLTWAEQDAIDNLMAEQGTLGVDVLGRDTEGNVILRVHAIDPDATDGPVQGTGTLTFPVAISDEADGAKYSVDGILFVPTVERLGL